MATGRTISLLLGVALCGASGPSLAALSPYYQSIAEIQRILADPRLGEAFASQEAIRSISSPKQDVYELKTEHCTVAVTVVDRPAPAGQPMRAGPRLFDLQFGKAACK
ncbi:hypothetical protein BH10PSE9_BH10PSE9_18420 [soil metagenome]